MATGNNWNWLAREHATGLIHRIKSGTNVAVTWCERHIIVRWDNWTEMPHCAVVTCLRCMTAQKAPR